MLGIRIKGHNVQTRLYQLTSIPAGRGEPVQPRLQNVQPVIFAGNRRPRTKHYPEELILFTFHPGREIAEI